MFARFCDALAFGDQWADFSVNAERWSLELVGGVVFFSILLPRSMGVGLCLSLPPFCEVRAVQYLIDVVWVGYFVRERAMLEGVLHHKYQSVFV